MTRQIVRVGWQTAPVPPFTSNYVSASAFATMMHTADFKHLVLSNYVNGQVAWFDGNTWSAPAAMRVLAMPSGFSPVAQDGKTICYFDNHGGSGGNGPTNRIHVCTAGSNSYKTGAEIDWFGCQPIGGTGTDSWSDFILGLQQAATPYVFNSFLWFPETPDYVWSPAYYSRGGFSILMGFSILTGLPIGALSCDLDRPDLYLWQNGVQFLGTDGVGSIWTPPGFLQWASTDATPPSNFPGAAIPIGNLFRGASQGSWWANLPYHQAEFCFSASTQIPLTPNLLLATAARLTGTASVGMPLANTGTPDGWPVGALPNNEVAAMTIAQNISNAVRGPGGIMVANTGVGEFIESVTYYQVDGLGNVSGGIDVALPPGFTPNSSNWAMGFIGSSPYLLDGSAPALYGLEVVVSDLDVKRAANWHMGWG